MRDDHHIFSIALFVCTRQLLGEIYHLIELILGWLAMQCWFLFTWWFVFRFLIHQFDMRNWWIWTWIDYYHYITSKPTNQVCKSPHSDCLSGFWIHISWVVLFSPIRRQNYNYIYIWFCIRIFLVRIYDLLGFSILLMIKKNV